MELTTEEVFALRLRKEREVRGWTTIRLAGEAALAGSVAFDPSMISKIEKGPTVRRVKLDEAVALCAALDVPLVAMLSPDESDRLRLTDSAEVAPAHFRIWMRGTQPLDPQNEAEYFAAAPASERKAFEIDGLRGVVRGAATMLMWASLIDSEVRFGAHEALNTTIRAMAGSVRRLRDAVRDLMGES